ncbi:hypothetical protein [Colwellia sp. MEBiC06753]
MAISNEQLQQKIAELPKEISPERELWTGIEKAINDTDTQAIKTKDVVYPVAWAASIVAAVMLTWVNIAPTDVSTAQPSLVAALNQDFKQQKQLMLTSYGQPDLTQLPADMQEELAKLAQARASITAALENDENNTDLINLLQWTQQQELELIKRLYAPKWQTI